jgi:hypothetical protein
MSPNKIDLKLMTEFDTSSAACTITRVSSLERGAVAEVEFEEEGSDKGIGLCLCYTLLGGFTQRLARQIHNREIKRGGFFAALFD